MDPTRSSGVSLASRAVYPYMKVQGSGKIVNIASGVPFKGTPIFAHYTTSKGAVLALTRVLARSVGKDGICVNTLAPGAIETELVAKMHDEETRRAYLQAIPARRYGTPEEVAVAAVFLAMPEASYINGIVMTIDGGFISSGVLKNEKSS